MTGKELYDLYAQRTLELQNCMVDTWEDLEESHHEVWEALAVDVTPED